MRMNLKVVLASCMILLTTTARSESLPVNTRLGGDFTLSSTREGVGHLSDIKGKPVLLNFGYTHCPDICPMTLQRMARVMRGLDNDAGKVQAVFVSFDPARDTLPHLQSYVTAFYPDMIAMTGTPEQIATAAKQYGVVYYEEPGNSAAGTLFAHSDFIYLVDKQNRVRAVFNGEQSVGTMTDTIKQLLNEE